MLASTKVYKDHLPWQKTVGICCEAEVNKWNLLHLEDILPHGAVFLSWDSDRDNKQLSFL